MTYRPPTAKSLDVYLAGKRAGELERRSGGRMRFTYDAECHTPISVALPLRSDPFPPSETQPFFTGLLPDESLWSRIGLRLGRGGAGPFELLSLLGRDTAGAMQILSPGTPPDPTTWPAAPEVDQTIEWLDSEALTEEIGKLSTSPLGINDERRFSLAGIQEKLLVTRGSEGQLGIPRLGRPSTHILKPDNARYQGAVINELYCMKLASAVGINAAQVDLIETPATSSLLVERFDRDSGTAGIERLHQEDACQALFIMPQDRYQDQGGPRIVDLLDLLKRTSVKAAADRLELLYRLMFNWLIGNCDAHGKNHALLHGRSGAALSPAYDLLSTEVLIDNQALAMTIGGDWNPTEVVAEHWRAELEHAGIGTATMKLLINFANKVRSVATTTTDPGSPWMKHSDIISPIVELVDERAQRLEATASRLRS